MAGMRIRLPVLFINFKTFEEATGRRALALARKADAVASEEGASIVLVVQAADLRLVSSAVNLPVFAQHLDPVEFGSHTGAILPEAIKEAGAVGVVLNHAENKVDNRFLRAAISEAMESGLLVMACAEDLRRAKQIASFGKKPDFIAVEPPGLIGKLSFGSSEHGFISRSVEAIKAIDRRIVPITGAGISDADDVRAALSLGTRGVFVATAIVKAGRQKPAIRGIVSGFRS